MSMSWPGRYNPPMDGMMDENAELAGKPLALGASQQQKRAHAGRLPMQMVSTLFLINAWCRKWPGAVMEPPGLM